MITSTDGRTAPRTERLDKAYSGQFYTDSFLFYKRSYHVFDSQYGKPNGSGYSFRYTQSLDKIVRFRVVSVLVNGIPNPFSNPVYLAVHSNLARASYSGHRNGSPENIISFISNPGTSTRIVWNYLQNNYVPIELDTIQEVYLELRDPVGAPQPEFRFVIVIEFTHQF